MAEFSVLTQLENRIREATTLIYRLREENRLLRQQRGPSASSGEGHLLERVAQLERRVRDLDAENQDLKRKKQAIKEKIDVMLQKYDILEL